MPTLPEIKKQTSSLGIITSFLFNSTIKELVNILNENENIKYIQMASSAKTAGLVLCTENRLIFIHKTLNYSKNIIDIPYSKITTIEISAKQYQGSLIIYCSGVRIEIDGIKRKDCDNMYQSIKRAIDELPISNNIITSDIISQIERLASLKEKGFLTEVEFNEQKGNLLKLQAN